ncbi:MAG: hypothetical protein IJX99_09875 [Clostridia bacterium]|nr:hypothetical protein [Clostridia bacterium]
MSCFTKSRDDGTRVIFIWAPKDANAALSMLDKHIRYNLVTPKMFNRAVLCHKHSADENAENPDNYQLKIYSVDGKTELWMSGFETGSRNVAAHGAVQALMLMGFEISPERDVLGLARGKEKTFKK